MKLVTVAEMRAIEALAEAHGTPLDTLMDRAGAALAEAILADYGDRPGGVLVLVGPGKNGGDGLVAARYLVEGGVSVTAYAWRHAADDPVYIAAHKAGVPMLGAEDDLDGQALVDALGETDILVDALLGIGVTRPLEGDLARLMTRVREAKRPDTVTVAVDLPSGVNADTGAADPLTLPADTTVTFGLPKRGLFLFPAAGLVGDVIVADIGLDPAWADAVRVELIDDQWTATHLPARPPNAHKGTFGKAMIIAGSANYTGAAYLAGAAATRVGAGLVTLAVAGMLYPILAARLAETTWLLLPHDMGALIEDAVKVVREKVDDYTALLLGPGLGQEEVTVNFVRRLLTGQSASTNLTRRVGFHVTPDDEGRGDVGGRLPLVVIDADGLNALAATENWSQALNAASAILTPHPGEMGRLLGLSTAEVEADRLATARRAAEQFGQVVVLKGAHTVIAAPDGRVRVSPFANPALASAGTGDVLAGSIVGFLAQGLAPFDAAAVGVFIHALAGERARDEMGDAGVVASDLLPRLPLAIRSIRWGD